MSKTENDAILSVRGLKTWFAADTDAPARAVDGVSFDIGRGETMGLLGESGCGKSITALSVMRLLPASGRIVAGGIDFQGEALLQKSEIEMRRMRGSKIAMIFQEPMTSLNPVLSIGDQIGESLAQHLALSARQRRERVWALLEQVGISDPPRRAREFPHQFSGGMKQRVMIAAALACEPQLLIADEPTTALDVTVQAQILELLKSLQRERDMSVLLITHDLAVLADTADRIAVMYAGQIVEQADTQSFINRPAHPYSRKLFQSLPSWEKRRGDLSVIRGFVPNLGQRFNGCRFAPRCDHANDDCHSTPPKWRQISGDRGVRCLRHDDITDEAARAAAAGAKTRRGGEDAKEGLLRVTDLRAHFPIQKGVLKRTVGFVKAVDGVDLAIAAGKTLALVGESGCGKTTVGKSVLQLIKPTAGSVLFENTELTALSRREMNKRRRDMQIIFQDPYSSLNPRMLTQSIVAEGISHNTDSAADKGADKAATKAQAAARVDELLRQVGLDADMKNRYPHEFSGGQRQRIAIARALAARPKLIVCDEPTSALDVSVQAQILNLLKQLQAELRIGYLFVTHDISVVSWLADEVAVMYLGRIVEQGPTRAVLSSPRHPYTRALLSAVPQIDRATSRPTIKLPGDPPSPSAPPPGCHFHPRCPDAMPRCQQEYPDWRAVGNDHKARCYLLEG